MYIEYVNYGGSYTFQWASLPLYNFKGYIETKDNFEHVFPFKDTCHMVWK